MSVKHGWWTAAAVFAIMMLPVLVGPASAQTPGLWTLDCKGSGGRGSVSWNWLLNGAPIPGVGGSATCADTMTVTGTSARPADANGVEVALLAFAGYDEQVKSATKSFDPGTAFKVQLGASVTDRVCVFFIEPRTCLLWEHVHERAQFTLEA